MSNKLEDKINTIRGNPNTIDLSMNDDPIAKKISWSAIKSLECKFRIHSAVKISFDKLEFRATKGAILFYLVFIFCGFGVLALVGYRFFVTAPSVIDTEFILLSLFGLVFTSVESKSSDRMKFFKKL